MNPSRICLSLALVGVFAFSLFFAVSRPVLADPHATFFTAVGQQQLFFNMLAALDQADYVEPSVDTLGTSEADSREELLQNRSDTPVTITKIDPETGEEVTQEIQFQPENNPTLNATKTDLASILTRNVTLEGNDVWSTYLAQQFALEGVRRRNATELLKIYCERGLGIKDCDLESEQNPRVRQARRESALVADPLGPIEAVYAAGRAALLSAIAPEYDQERRRELARPNTLETNKYRPYDGTVASLYQSGGGGSQTAVSDQYKQGLVAQWTTAALNQPSGLSDPSFLDDIEFDADGNVIFPDNASIDTITGYMSDVLAKPVELFDARLAAENKQREVNTYKNIAGARAVTFAKTDTNTASDDDSSEQGALASQTTYGEIAEEILIPAYVRASQTQDAVRIPSEGEIHPYAISANESLPGDTQFVPGQGSQTPGTRPPVQPPNTVGSSSPGLVAGDDDTIESFEEEDFFAGDPESGAVPPERSFTRTPGIVDFLTLLGGQQRGCGCSLQDILSGYGGNIIGP